MNRLLSSIALAAAVAVFTPHNALAQESPRAGVVLASNSGVAFTFQVTERVAIRPEISFSRSAAESKLASGGEFTNRSITPEIGILFYLSKQEALRTYFVPRYAHQRVNTKSTSGAGTTTSTNTAHTVSGSFGAEYAIHQRFAAFGELGFVYGRADSASSRINSVSHRTTAGVIFFF